MPASSRPTGVHTLGARRELERGRHDTNDGERLPARADRHGRPDHVGVHVEVLPPRGVAQHEHARRLGRVFLRHERPAKERLRPDREPEAEPQRERRGETETGLSEPTTHRVPQILAALVGEPQAAGLPAVVLHAFDAPEVQPGAPHCFPHGHAGADQVPRHKP